MDLSALPVSSENALKRLKLWVETESPTFDRAAVNRMMDVAASDLAALGACVTRVEGTKGFGDSLVARFPHPRADEPGILVMGHLDTVHPLGTLEALPFRLDGERCYGPGILDMKGGCVAALEAISSLGQAGIETPLPMTVLLTSDEEVGTPSNRALIEKEAARHKYVLVPEPALGKGDVVTGRYAIARFDLEARGRPSHAGQSLADGRSAIRIMAEKIIAIEGMSTGSYTFSVGTIAGGTWVNCVPTSCKAEALSMAKRQEDLDLAVERLNGLASSDEEGTFLVHRNVTRPVWEPDEKTMALCILAQRVARQWGQTIGHGSAGGGSDGNFTGALSIATLDGLGLTDEGLHTLQEYIEVESLAQRIRLIAGMMAELA